MAGTIIFSESQRLLSSDVLLPKPQDISISSTTQTYTSVSQNLSVESRTRGVQRWQVNLNWPPLNREEAMRVYSFMISQQGTFDSFEIVLPTPLNVTNGVQIDQTGSQGTPMSIDARSTVVRSIAVGNFNPSATGALKAGDFFKFSNHEKLYMVTTDLNTASEGTGTLNFTPPVIASLVGGSDLDNNDVYEGGTTIIHTNPKITVSLKTDQFEIPIDENVHYAMSVELGERTTPVL